MIGQATDRAGWVAGAILVLLVTIVYWPTLDAGFVSDAEYYIRDNLDIRSLHGLADIWLTPGRVEQYYPLVFSSFWAEYHLWGLDARGYHAVNFLLHAASAVLVWRLLARLGLRGAWLAAAIFAVHPVEVDSVAMLHERTNVLSCVLALGSLLAYLRFSPPEIWRQQAGGRRLEADQRAVPGRSARDPSFILHPSSFLYYALAFVLYVAALLAKTVTASVPAVLLVIYWWKRGRLTWRDVLPTLPFFVVGLALSSITVAMEKTYVGASGKEFDFSLLERALIAGRVLWFYAGKLAWPYPLISTYPRWEVDPRAGWQYLFPAAAVLVVVGLWLARARVGRGPLAAVLIFAGVLVPALGFFNLVMFRFTFVFDHLQYHASIALIALLAAALALVALRLSKHGRWLGPVAVAGLLVPLAVVARDRTSVYHDSLALWRDTIKQVPESWVGHYHLGFGYRALRRYDEALCEFRKAIDMRGQQATENPAIGKYAEDVATCYVDLGLLEGELGRAGEAESSLRTATDIREKLVHDHPAMTEYQDSLAWCYVYLAAAQHKAGHSTDAIASYRRALETREELDRKHPTIGKYKNLVAGSHADIGVLMHKLGRPQDAENALRLAIAIREKLVGDHPAVADYRARLAATYEDLALTLQSRNRLTDAVTAREKAIKVREELAERNLWPILGTYQSEGRFLDSWGARRAQDLVKQYRDDLAGGYVDLGLLERELGRLAEAQNSFRRAIEIREELVRDYPAAAEYQDGLAWCYVDLALAQRESGAAGDALASHRKAIEVRDQLVRNNPQNGKYQNNLAASFVDLGLSQRAAGQPAQAENALRKAIKIRDALVRDHPAATEYRDGLAWCYVYLVVAQFEAGRLADAERSCRQAIQIREKLVQDNPTADGYQQQLALSFRDLGNLQRAAGQIGDAAASYHRAIEIRQKLLRDDPADAARQSTLAADLALEGDAQASLSNWSGSAEAYAQAVQRGDSSWPTLERLALVQLAAGDEAAYRSTCADLIKRHADDAAADAALAMALTVVMGENALPDMNQALALAQRAAEADPANPLPQVAVGAAQYRAGHVPEAIGTLTDALWRFNSAPRSAPATTPQTFLGRLLGEMFLALAYREQADSEALPPQLAALRTWIDQAETPAPPAPAGLPPWTLRCAVALAKRELAKLDPPNEPSGQNAN